MSCVFISADEDAWRSALPSNLNFLPFNEVNENTIGKNCLVKGKVTKTFPVFESAKQRYLKVIITEIDCSSSEMKLFLVGEFLEQCKSIGINDVIVVSDPSIETDPKSERNFHAHQLIADINKTDTKIWILKSSNIASVKEKDSGATTSKKASTKNAPYLYTSLADLHIGDIVNVYGVVKFFKPPFKTKKTDYLMIISIVDNSLTNPKDKLKCNLFMKEPALLPPVRISDIIRFHRLKIADYQGELQATPGPGFSWTVFDGSDDATLTPIKFSHDKCTSLSDEERRKVIELRNWSNSDSSILSQQIQSSTTLSQIHMNQYFDLVCQIVSTCVVLDNESFSLQVWDGTKLSIESFKQNLTPDLKSKMVVDDKILQSANGYVVDVWVYDEYFKVAAKLKPGEFVKLRNVHAASHKFKESEIGGSFNRPMVDLCLHRGGTQYNRGIDVLCRNDSDVQRLPLIDILKNDEQLEIEKIRTHSDPISSDNTPGLEEGNVEDSFEQYFTPESAIQRKSIGIKRKFIDDSEAYGSGSERCMKTTATVIMGHSHIEKTSLCDVLKTTPPNKFRVCARIVDYQPKSSSPKEFLRLYCEKCHFLSVIPNIHCDSLSKQDTNATSDWLRSATPHHQENQVEVYSCPICCQSGTSDMFLQYIYMLQFILKDGSDWLCAGLWRQEAEKFFHGISATDLIRSETWFSRIMDNLDQICDGKAVVECCLKSYTNSDFRVAYQIFDTVLSLE